MKANRKKLMLAMARACMDTEDLQKAAEMPRTNAEQCYLWQKRKTFNDWQDRKSIESRCN